MIRKNLQNNIECKKSDEKLHKVYDELKKTKKKIQMEKRKYERLKEEVLQSEKNLKEIFNNSLIGMYRTTPNGKILMSNSTLVKKLGYKSYKELSKRNLENKEWYHPKYPRSDFKKNLEHEGHVIGLESAWTRKDGSTIFIRENVTAVYDNNNNILYYDGTIENITERKKIENKIKESEERWRSLVENIPEEDRVLIVDKDGKILYVNRVQSNRSIHEILGKNALDFTEPKDRLKIKKILEAVFSSGKPAKYESKTITSDGYIIIYDTIAAPIKDNDSVKAVILIARDITKIKNAELERKKIDERYRLLLENSGCPITYIDLNGKIILINNLGAKNLNGKPDDFIGKSIYQILPKFADEQKKRIQEIMETRTGIKREDRIEIPSGIRWFLSYLEPVKNKNKNIIGIQIFSIDVTDRKKAELERQKGKEYLQNIIDSTFEIIFTVGSDFKIKTWNKTAVKVIGYKHSHVVGKFVKKLNLFEDQDELQDYIQVIFKGGSAVLEELTVKTAFGLKKLLSVSPSYIKDESGIVTEILFVCKDISYVRERHGKLLFGQSYFISDTSKGMAVDIFKGLISSEKPGLYISRTGDLEINTIFTEFTPRIVKLSSEKEKNHQTCSNIEELICIIEDYVVKEEQSVILLDRVDYLIMNSSFESVIKNIYRLSDKMKKYNCLLLLNINPLLLDKTQMEILKEEVQQLPKQQVDMIQIEETLFDILKFIQIENQRNTIVSYSKIGKRFSISKVTTQKRIESLIGLELVFSKKIGKIKTLNITDKGNNLLARRTVI